MTIKEFVVKIEDMLLEMTMERSCVYNDGYDDAIIDIVKGIRSIANQSEQERTNFENWKDELTVEQVVEIIKEVPTCKSCPVCQSAFDFDCGKVLSCEYAIIEWANKRSEK